MLEKALETSVGSKGEIHFLLMDISELFEF